MGHRHHRKHRGCGRGSCEICIPGVPAYAVPGYGPPAGFAGPAVVPGMPVAVDVMAPNGQILATAPYGQVPLVQSSALRFGQDVMAPALPPTYNQLLMTQYAAMRSAAGFPVSAIVSPLGFKAKKVRKKKTRTVVARPETFFTGKGIFISKCVAKHFDICALRVGQIYVMGGKDPVPAEMFTGSECGGGYVISLPPVGPGQHIYLTVKNRDNHSHWFRAGIQGLALV